MLAFGMFVVSNLSAEEPQLKTKAPIAAVFSLKGTLLETPIPDDPLFGAVGKESLNSMIARLDKAAADDNVKAVVFLLSSPELNYAQVEELREAMDRVKAVGKKGIQMYRFKGLGEMDAKELFETTMNPVKRKLLRIDLTDAVEAEEMFVRLMGDEVEPRRQFIEDNALNVRNLDV